MVFSIAISLLRSIDAPYVISNNRSIHCLMMMMMIQCLIPCQRQQASNLAINATAVVARVVVQALVVARHVIMIRHVNTHQGQIGYGGSSQHSCTVSPFRFAHRFILRFIFRFFVR